jgi:hypothetical protein
LQKRDYKRDAEVGRYLKKIRICPLSPTQPITAFLHRGTVDIPVRKYTDTHAIPRYASPAQAHLLSTLEV